jgi:hypothetical protein
MQKKSKMFLAATGAGLSLIVGGVTVANADSNSPGATKIQGGPRIGGGMGSQLNHVLTVLVANGTITQAQSDAILKEAAAERATQSASIGALVTAQETLIATTIGSDWPTILKRLQGGESLAAIAGSKTGDLVTALVNEASTRIDAAVTAGRLTAAQAKSLKANLQSWITTAVNATGQLGEMLGGPGGFMAGMRAHRGPGGFGGGPIGERMGGFGGPTAPVSPPA